MKETRKLFAACMIAALLCGCAPNPGSATASEAMESASVKAGSLPATAPATPDGELEALRFFDDGSRIVTVCYGFPDADGAVDAARSGEAVYDLKNTQTGTEQATLRFLPESLTGLNDFSSPVTDAADQAFLLAQLEGLAPPENGVLPEPQSNPIYLYVDDVCYAFYHTGEIVGDGVCGTCSDFFRVSALSYKYLAADTGKLALNDTLLALSDGQDAERPAATEENYGMWILGEGIQKELSLSQTRAFLHQLLGEQYPTGEKTAWDWSQPAGGICLAEQLGDLENHIWLYPDGSVCFLRSCATEGPWRDGSVLYGQSDWDIYKTSWQRAYRADSAFEWSQLQKLVTP